MADRLHFYCNHCKDYHEVDEHGQTHCPIFEDPPKMLPASPQPPRVRFDNVTISYTDNETGKMREAVKNISFSIYDKPVVGETVVILGPSGCGKSTILKATAGLLPVTEGVIEVLGKPVGPPAKDRGMVFQNYTSFGWYTVLQNVEYGLRMAGVAKAERREKALEILAAVGLQDFADAFPKELSGGMKQRVAIARTLINDAEVILMDEPFGALDPQTRWEMQGLILDLNKKADNTVIFVTHDVAEAVYLADTIYVLSSRPATIRHTINVPYFADRSLSVKNSDEFRAIEQEILDFLHSDPKVRGNIRVGV
jgi:NitT/TauT family transport system ATP-binding protein